MAPVSASGASVVTIVVPEDKRTLYDKCLMSYYIFYRYKLLGHWISYIRYDVISTEGYNFLSTCEASPIHVFTLLKIFKGTLHVLPLILIQMHSYSDS